MFGILEAVICTSFSLVTPPITTTCNYFQSIPNEEQISTSNNNLPFKQYNVIEDANYGIVRTYISMNIQNYKKEMNYLNELFENYEDHHKEIISYLNSKSKDQHYKDLFDWILQNENNENKYLILSFILDSDINIFDIWYVKNLKKCINSDDILLRKRALSIYGLYRKQFEDLSC